MPRFYTACGRQQSATEVLSVGAQVGLSIISHNRFSHRLICSSKHRFEVLGRTILPAPKPKHLLSSPTISVRES